MNYWRQALFFHAGTATARPVVGCSACLLGEAVRYDGGHKLQASFESRLAPYLQLQPICPEVGIGLGVPRATLKVVDRRGVERVVGVEDENHDVTADLEHYADQHLLKVGTSWPLSAWIFKARSPSCGVDSALVNPDTNAERRGYGAFARRVHREAPWLVLYEEEELEEDAGCCEEFLLLSFLCLDVLWQRVGSTMELRQHYGKVFGELAAPENDSRLVLWQQLRSALNCLPVQERRDLIGRFRA